VDVRQNLTVLSVEERVHFIDDLKVTMSLVCPADTAAQLRAGALSLIERAPQPSQAVIANGADASTSLATVLARVPESDPVMASALTKDALFAEFAKRMRDFIYVRCGG